MYTDWIMLCKAIALRMTDALHCMVQMMSSHDVNHWKQVLTEFLLSSRSRHCLFSIVIDEY